MCLDEHCCFTGFKNIKVRKLTRGATKGPGTAGPSAGYLDYIDEDEDDEKPDIVGPGTAAQASGTLHVYDSLRCCHVCSIA